MQAALWPIHCSGRMWSYAMFRVPAGFALVPLETTTATVVGSAAGLGLAIALAVFASDRGLADGPALLGAQVVAAVVGGYAGRRWAMADAMRRMERMLADPAKALRRWGAWVLPATAVIATTREASGGGKATIHWTDAKGKDRKVVLTVPSNLLADFADLWKAPATRA